MTFNIEITFAPDTDLLAEIHKECFPTAWNAAAMRDLLSITGTVAFCVDDKAFGLLRVLAGEAEILTLAVRPAYRGQGVAKAIVQAMIAYGRQQKAQKIFLEVRTGNAEAITLYTNAGFALLSGRKDYYAIGAGRYENALVLSYTL